MKLAIIGSRNFDDYDFMVEKIQQLIDITTLTAIVSGGAQGADTLAEQFANQQQLEMIVFKPDYKKYSRAATMIRNRAIIEHSDIVIAFWDGKSTGTKYSFDYAKKKNKVVHICKFDTPIQTQDESSTS